VSNLRRVTKKSPCPVCKHPDYCGVFQDGSHAICMRIRSDKRTRNGGYIHRIDGYIPPEIIKKANKNHAAILSCRAEIEQRDGIYSGLLRSHLVLSLEHRNSLLKRGLSGQAINRNGYKSVPDVPFADNVARELSKLGLEGVPGFYFDKSWKMFLRASGFFIPVRDSQSRIQALQIRQDEGQRYIWFSSPYKYKGTSSGAPIHFQNTHLIKDTGRAIITEGALKADVIAYLQNTGTIGIAGVSTFPEDFGFKLKEELLELEHLTIAFDSDWFTNPHVKQALFRLIKALEKARIKVRVRTWWNGAKGYDDYLQGAA